MTFIPICPLAAIYDWFEAYLATRRHQAGHEQEGYRCLSPLQYEPRA